MYQNAANPISTKMVGWRDTGCLDNVLPVDAIGCHIPRGSNKNGNTITINIVYTSKYLWVKYEGNEREDPEERSVGKGTSYRTNQITCGKIRVVYLLQFELKSFSVEFEFESRAQPTCKSALVKFCDHSNHKSQLWANFPP